jgi:hypothetical protein
MLLALAFGFAAAIVPHTELPSKFSGDRLFVAPRVANSTRRLTLWVDTDGDGFLRSGVVEQLHVKKGWMRTAFLPPLDEPAFPPVTGNNGALAILNDAEVANDPIFAGLDGQLGWSWLSGRIWTIDYPGRHFYWDHTAPAYSAAARVPLGFPRGHRFPSLGVVIDGKNYNAALDTAATVDLSQRTLAKLNDGIPPVRATSFIPHRTLEAWHAAHSDWTYVEDAGASPGVALIRVPEVHAARVTFRNVWFSTRSNDDVFRGEQVDMKLGPTAYHNCTVTVDYVHDAAGFECKS